MHYRGSDSRRTQVRRRRSQPQATAPAMATCRGKVETTANACTLRGGDLAGRPRSWPRAWCVTRCGPARRLDRPARRRVRRARPGMNQSSGRQGRRRRPFLQPAACAADASASIASNNCQAGQGVDIIRSCQCALSARARASSARPCRSRRTVGRQSPGRPWTCRRRTTNVFNRTHLGLLWPVDGVLSGSAFRLVPQYKHASCLVLCAHV
jgi:hypothetical protein